MLFSSKKCFRPQNSHILSWNWHARSVKKHVNVFVVKFSGFDPFIRQLCSETHAHTKKNSCHIHFKRNNYDVQHNSSKKKYQGLCKHNIDSIGIANSLFYTWNLELFRLILAKVITKLMLSLAYAFFFCSPCLSLRTWDHEFGINQVKYVIPR